MKYLAILKDSFREALDCRVLFVLFGLSTIIIVLVATLSVKLLPAEKTMQQFFSTGNELPLTAVLDSHKPEKMAKRRKGKKNHSFDTFRLVKVECVRGEADAPDSDYALTIAQDVFRSEKVGDKDKLRADGADDVRSIFQDAEEFGYLRIGSVEAIDGGEMKKGSLQYRVTLQGTPTTLRIWFAEVTLLGVIPIGKMLLFLTGAKAGQLGFQLYVVARLVLYTGAWVAVLTGIIITSFFVPNMLRKGAVDLLLVKPVKRWLLLMYKYVGSLTFIFLSAAYAVVGIWLVLGIRTGCWANGLLLLIFTITFFFAILYAISTFIAVLTRSTVTAILVTIVAWIVFFGIGLAQKEFNDQYLIQEDAQKRGRALPEDEKWGDNAVARVVRVIHATTPRTSDLDQLNEMIVFCDFMTGNLADMEKFDTSKRNWWDSLLVSVAWIAVFLGLAALRFTFRDY